MNECRQHSFFFRSIAFLGIFNISLVSNSLGVDFNFYSILFGFYDEITEFHESNEILESNQQIKKNTLMFLYLEHW